MTVRLASDLPRDIRNILAIIDFEKIQNKEQLEARLPELEALANKYLSKRLREPIFQMVEIKGCTQKFLDFINKWDFGTIGILKRKIARQFILQWLKENVPLKS